MHITSQDIRHYFDATTFGRGDGYHRQGRVLSVHLNGELIEGQVEGSGYQPYRQSIKLANGRRGIEIDGDCSCPMYHNCKHVVAVLLSFADSQAAAVDNSAAGAGLPMAMAHWLHRVAQAATTQANKPADKPKKAGHRLVYVLMPDQTAGGAVLCLCKARLRAAGDIAAATLVSDLYSLNAFPPEYVGLDDHLPARLFTAMRSGGAFGGPTAEPAGATGAQLLDMLLDTGRLLWADARDALKTGALHPVAAGPARDGGLAWRRQADGDDTLRLEWQFSDGTPLGIILPTDPPMYLQDRLLGQLNMPHLLAAMPIANWTMLVAQAPRLAARDALSMSRQLMAQGLEQCVPMPQALQSLVRDDIPARPTLLLGCLGQYPGPDGRPAWADYAVLAFDYDGLQVMPGDAQAPTRLTAAGSETIERDAAREQAAGAALAALGFAAATAAAGAVLELPSQQHWLDFAARDLPSLRAQGWRVEFAPGYRFDLSEIEDWYAQVDQEEGAGNAWFELELGIVVNQRQVALLPVLLQMIRHAPHDFNAAALEARGDGEQLIASLPDGLQVALPWGRIKPILRTLGELYFNDHIGDSLRLPTLDMARLAELESVAQLRWMGGEHLRELGRKLHAFDRVRQVDAPAGLQGSLRGYQRDGLSWMQFLREYDLAGILADDMGLGKTIQTLSHILVEKEAGRLDAPAMVVAPTSLMSNWQEEAARFAPGLRVLLLQGPERAQRFGEIDGADLVLTSYALLSRDEEELRRHRFHLLILDESQYIKNSRSKAAQTAGLLQARHRLCLTGTPLQNHLGELWSQFHFLMPGLLGDEKGFNADFRKPIEKQGDGARNAFLIRRIKPFLLRRTKDNVAKELPPKTEMVRTVDLAGAQRDLYETVRLAMDKKVREEIARKGAARSQIVILDALLKLRQVCCDPRLVSIGGKRKSTAPSAKLDALMELLDELLDEGRRILVFSQFTSMLALIEAELKARGVAYALLTGDTEDRAAQVAVFQQGRAPVFLISLKAGGVGLNLTAADTVIHYDPWWNPAAENQATDRAWRIGQDKPVFVYRLIARGTLEEKIQELQRRKSALADAVLEGGETQGLQITQEDLLSIFKAV